MRFAITAFASRQARGRRRWESSSAANSSSSRCLRIRCRTMTVIHRSGRCDKRDMKSRRGCRLGFSCYCPPHDHLREQGNERKLLRGESEGCQRACYLCFRTAVLHETHETAAWQLICRAPARCVGKAKSYQLFLMYDADESDWKFDLEDISKSGLI